MQEIIAFLLKYYIYFLFGIILFILGLIGYLVDSHKMAKYEQNVEKEKENVNIPIVDNKRKEFSDIKIDKIGKLSSYQKVEEKPIEIEQNKPGV